MSALIHFKYGEAGANFALIVLTLRGIVRFCKILRYCSIIIEYFFLCLLFND